jgi:hypothetical protein
MVGLWTEHRTSNDHSSPCASFEFFGDGTFEAKNIPSDRFVYEGYLPERINVHGIWKLDTSSNDPFAVHRIVLVFDPFKGFPLGMGSVLYIPVGGAGNRSTKAWIIPYFFGRETSAIDAPLGVWL